MLLTQVVLFVHIVSAIVLLAGVIGGHIVGAVARRAPDLEHRRGVVALGTPFERMTTVAVPLTIVSGLVTLTLFGYAITDLWVLASGFVTLVIVAIQVPFWNRIGPRIHDALARGDDATAVVLMRDPRAVAIGRLEVALAFVIVALMVFRPGWPG